MTGPEWDNPQTFTYAQMPDGVKTFENIELGTYTVTESIEEGGKTYTTTCKVDSGDATEGTAASAKVDADGATVAFTNTYQETEATLDVEKDIETADGVTAPEKTFSFKMSAGSVVEAGEAEVPMPADGDITASVTGEGKASEGEDTFGAITYTKAGKYTYTITETGTADTGWTYNVNGDITATVTVTEGEDGALSAAITYDKTTGGKITNKYEVGSLTVTKTFAGNTEKLEEDDKKKDQLHGDRPRVG